MTARLTALQDAYLSKVSNMLTPHGLVSGQVLPFIAVKETTGLIANYGNVHLQAANSRVGGDGKFKKVESVERDRLNYLLERHGLYDVVTQDDYRNVIAPYQAEVDVTVGLTSILMTERERAFKNLFAASELTQGINKTAATEKYKDPTSDPFGDFQDAHNTVLEMAGVSPDVVICPRKVANVLRTHPQIRDFFRRGASQGKGGPIIEEELKMAFGVNRMFIPESPEADSTGAISQIWPDDIIFLVAPPAAARRQVSFGYRLGDNVGGGDVRIWKFATTNPPLGLDVLAGINWEFKTVNPLAGYAIRNAI